MAAVAEVQTSRGEVEQTDEHRDEHAVLIVFRQLVVDARSNLVGLVAALGKSTEQSHGLCHEQRCRHSLSRDVAHTEVQAVVLQQTVVQVASHLTGRNHLRIDVKALVLRKVAGHHGHLDVTGNAQFTLDTFLLCRHGCQALGSLTTLDGIDDEEHHHQDESHQHGNEPLVRQVSLLLGNLLVLLLCLVDDCQLSSIVLQALFPDSI